MSKQIIKLTESDLHNLIQESVKKIIKETYKKSDDIDILSNSLKNIVRLYRSYLYDTNRICVYDAREERDAEYLIRHNLDNNIIQLALKNQTPFIFVNTKNKNILATITEKAFLNKVENDLTNLKKFVEYKWNKVSCLPFLQKEKK